MEKKKITLKERYSKILEWFSINSKDAKSELVFENPYQLMVSVILSAQCTDKRVNMTTPALFKRFPTPEAMSNSTEEDILELIKSISFPNNKAAHLLSMSKRLVSVYHSVVPSDVEELMTLQGVGRKTANVVASIVYNKPVIAVDTHVFRISKRLGLSKGETVEKVEKDLTKHIPVEQRATAHHWLILHGRYVCTARKPKCSECGLSEWCASYPLG